MKLSVTTNSDISSFLRNTRQEKSIASYALLCIRYCKDNNIDLHEYYKGIDNDRIENTHERGKD